MKVAIIKYNAGNVCSVQFAMERIGVDAIVTDDKFEIETSDKVIFPGVGEASNAMNYLKERKLNDLIVSLKQPVLGICLGMQLMCKYSEEGNTSCLGIFDQNVKRFPMDIQTDKYVRFKVPQIGWNAIGDLRSDIFKGIKTEEYMYFIHGYYVELGEHSISSTDYGLIYSSALNKDNFYATQFHPEKSGLAGQIVLENFIKL
jgi:glutamine amidotransferase